MKALTYSERGVCLEDRAQPAPAAGEALLRVRRAGICNTDLEIVRGYMGFTGILGHEIVGEIVELGPDTTIDPALRDRRVVPEINCACLNCPDCHHGNQNHCPHRTVLGILGKDGGMAEFVTVPVANLHPVGPEIADEAAIFVEPLAAAIHSFDEVQLCPGDRVLVIGDGKLGLLIAMALACRTEGLGQALVVGRHASKLSRLEALGLELCLEKDITDEGFDVVVEATGSASGLIKAMEVVRPKGTIIVKSTYAGSSDHIDLAPVVINELKLLGSRCGDFRAAIEVLERSVIDPRILITDRFKLSQGEDAFVRAAERESLKVVLDPLS